MERIIYRHTTSVSPQKTVADISNLLMKIGATGVMLEATDGKPSGINFRVDIGGGLVLAYRLPVNVKSVYRSMVKARLIQENQRGEEQAERTAWRIAFEWLRAQAAFIETGSVEAQEVFLPYLLLGKSKTLFDHVKEGEYKALPYGQV